MYTWLRTAALDMGIPAATLRRRLTCERVGNKVMVLTCQLEGYKAELAAKGQTKPWQAREFRTAETTVVYGKGAPASVIGKGRN